MENCKINFLGQGDFGEIIFQELLKNKYKPLWVKGLGEIKNPGLIIAASFGKIIPQNILEKPKHGCINAHPSLLPKYRGPSPIQTAILEGKKLTGITLFLMDKLIDHGPIIAQKKYAIFQNIYYKDLEKKLALLAARLLVKTLPQWLNEKITPLPQQEELATYTKIIKKTDGKINWNTKALKIERQIRAFYPWPGSFAFWNGKLLKIAQAKPLKSFGAKPGKVISSKEHKIIIQCRNSSLAVEKLQLEGKKEMPSQEFILGHPGIINSTL